MNLSLGIFYALPGLRVIWLLLLIASPVCAQDISRSITRSARSLAIQPATDTGVQLLSTIPTEPRPAPPPKHEITVGIGYEKADGDGHSVYVPLQYGYTTANGRWNFRLETGLERASSSAGAAKGLRDIALLASHVFAESDASASTAWKLIATGGLGVPTHGEVGSRGFSQEARLIGEVGQGSWKSVLAGVLVHVNGQRDGESSTRKVVQGEIHYAAKELGGTVIGKIDRSYRGGVGGNTTVTLEYDWPISKQVEGNLSFTRGLTKGARSNGVELVAVYQF